MKKHKTCACCGDYAGKWEQWFNQDTGFGVCPRCVNWIKNRVPFGRKELQITDDEFCRTYGKPGLHYSAPAQPD